MSKNVKRISLTAMLTALAVVLLYVSALLPTMRLALVVTAGLLTAVAILESGISAGIMLFAATSLLGLFVSPMRGTVLIYVLFFGYYPILKGLIEKTRRRAAEWTMKLLLFNAALTIAVYAYRTGFLTGIQIPDLAVVLFYLAANAAFVVYDIGFSRLMIFYLTKWKNRR
jgi:hypothetical protein